MPIAAYFLEFDPEYLSTFFLVSTYGCLVLIKESAHFLPRLKPYHSIETRQ
ncbi:hypothetical protein SynSYN20_00656 [Synechococcus sp. SYN20]|nr:hypothetical protein SynSYN20_00656 [Synechococcus sp. SYN20]